MTNKTILAQTVRFLFLLLSCQKENTIERDYPQVRTSAVNQITASGARFNAEIISGDVESISEYGFVWGLSSNLSVNSSEKAVIGEVPSGNAFYSDITFALEPMKEYYVRSYLKAGELTIYGDVLKFMSLGSQAPEITDFEPKSATWGDTVTIFGENFSFQRNNISVYFGDFRAQVTSNSNEFIKVLVPDAILSPCVISAEMYGNLAIAPGSFELITPGRINAIDKVEITWGDTLELEGIFPYSTHTIQVLIGGANSAIVEMTENKILAVVPNTIGYSDSVSVVLSIDGHKLSAPRKNHMIQPYISSIVQEAFGWGDTIEIKGLFHPLILNNKVYFSGIQASVIEVQGTYLKCIIPSNMNSFFCELTVHVLQQQIHYDEMIKLSGPLITSVDPQKALAGSNYITIHGKYFRSGNTSVKINNIICGLWTVTDSSIMAFVSDSQNRGLAKLEVTVLDGTTTINNAFTIEKVTVTEVTPNTGTYGDTIDIHVTDIDPGDLILFIGSHEPPIISASVDNIRTIVPLSTNLCPNFEIHILTRGQELRVYDKFQIQRPVINTIDPTSVNEGDIITIKGNHFCLYQNVVRIGNAGDWPLTATPTELTFRIPKLTTGNYYVDVTVGECTTRSPYTIHYSE